MKQFFNKFKIVNYGGVTITVKKFKEGNLVEYRYGDGKCHKYIFLITYHIPKNKGTLQNSYSWTNLVYDCKKIYVYFSFIASRTFYEVFSKNQK